MPKTRIVRQLRNGQITIPKEFREALHLGPDDLLAVTLDGGKLEVTGVKTTPTAGSPWLHDLYEMFAPARQSFAESGMTDDQVSAEIDAIIADARRAQR